MPKIQLRHDTAANWTTVNPVLLEGEIGIETDTKKQKIGDGSTAWNSLDYDLASTALQSITSSDVTSALGYTPVNKSGDTMSGDLTITKSKPVLYLKDSSQTAGTTPSNQQSNRIVFYDKNNVTVGYIQNQYDTNGARYLSLNCRNADCTANTSVLLGYDSNDNFSSSIPHPASNSNNNNIATTKWVNDKGYITGIGSSDVTSALGYTPYNGTTNPNGYITGITSSDVTTALGYTPVNKAGDTMSGTLTIDKSNSTLLNLKGTSTTILGVYNNVDYSTATSSGSCYSDIIFYDYLNNKRRNTIRSFYEYDNTGTLTASRIIIGTNKFDASAPQGLIVGYNGSSGYITSDFVPPATSSTSNKNIATCGWVNDATLSTNVVHRSNDETIYGVKTFKNSVLKVSKTGNLTELKAEDITISATPSSNKTVALIASVDNEGTRLGRLNYIHRADGSHCVTINDKKTGADSYSTFEIGWDSNGVEYTSVPHPTAGSNNKNIATTQWVRTKIDSQWVSNPTALATNVNLTADTETDIDYDLSNILPSDSNTYNYELLVSYIFSPPTGKSIRARLVGYTDSSTEIAARITTVSSTALSVFENGGNTIIPVSTNKTLTLRYLGTATLTTLRIEGYRRLGLP